jgi:hypothetical protein
MHSSLSYESASLCSFFSFAKLLIMQSSLSYESASLCSFSVLRNSSLCSLLCLMKALQYAIFSVLRSSSLYSFLSYEALHYADGSVLNSSLCSLHCHMKTPLYAVSSVLRKIVIMQFSLSYESCSFFRFLYLMKLLIMQLSLSYESSSFSLSSSPHLSSVKTLCSASCSVFLCHIRPVGELIAITKKIKQQSGVFISADESE